MYSLTIRSQAFFEQVVSQKCEGLMVKLLESGEGLTGEDEDPAKEDDEDTTNKIKGKGGRKKPLPSTYEPDARSQGWLKVKKDYLEGVADTLDLVPIGAWYGLGRKAGWWSPILLAACNPDTGALEAVCKCLAGERTNTDGRHKLETTLMKHIRKALPTRSINSYWTSTLQQVDPTWLARQADLTLTAKQGA
jgi:ATP-dependent DNA ligase